MLAQTPLAPTRDLGLLEDLPGHLQWCREGIWRPGLEKRSASLWRANTARGLDAPQHWECLGSRLRCGEMVCGLLALQKTSGGLLEALERCFL